MSKVFTVIGAGRQGKAVAADLLTFGGDCRVILADFDLAVAQAGADEIGYEDRLSVVQVDVKDEFALDALLSKSDIALGCVPYKFQPKVAQSALRTGKHALDLGCDTSDSHELLTSNPKDTCIVPDCGLAPGLVNVLGAQAALRVENAFAIRLFCGVLPQDKNRPLGYKISFSLDGLIGEYEDLAYVLRDGKTQELTSLTEFEEVFIEGVGQLEAFVTSGGSGTSPDLYVGILGTYEYKTLRYPGHGAAMAMFQELGFWSEELLEVDGKSLIPRNAFMRILEKRLTDPLALEVCILRAEAIGHGIAQVDLVLKQQPEDSFTAMERLTAYGITIPALAVSKGLVKPGSQRLEQAVPYDYLEAELVKRGVHLQWSIR